MADPTPDALARLRALLDHNWALSLDEKQGFREALDALAAAQERERRWPDFARHLPDCAQRHPLNRQGMPPYPCTCGLDRLLDEVEGKTADAPGEGTNDASA